MFKETLGSMQNSKYQRAHVRVMLKEPEFFIPDNGKNKRGGGGGETAFFFPLLWQTVPEPDTSVLLPAAG